MFNGCNIFFICLKPCVSLEAALIDGFDTFTASEILKTTEVTRVKSLLKIMQQGAWFVYYKYADHPEIHGLKST